MKTVNPMKLKKYALCILITVLLTISQSCGVNFKFTLLNSTAVAQTVNNRKAEADRLFEQGQKQYRSNQYYQALQSWEQSLTIYREIGNRRGVVNSLKNLRNAYYKLGNAYYKLRDYSKAIDYHQQSLAINKAIGNCRGMAASLENQGNAIVFDEESINAINYH